MRDGIDPERNRAEYLARIHRVMDHVEAHLGEDLSVEALARVGCFSPYHFHRVFGAVVGEPLMAFVTRLRLERAAGLLCQTKGLSVGQVGEAVGIPESTVFARAFRRQFGVSASQWRKGAGARHGNSKQGKVEGKESQDLGCDLDDLSKTTNTRRFSMNEDVQIKVEIREIAAMPLACVRHIGPYAGNDGLFQRLFGKLFAWAGPRGLVGPGTRSLTIYHDNPEVTAPEKLRITVALTVPAGTAVEGEIGAGEIPAGRYVVATCSIRPDQYAAAWSALMAGWFPGSGWQPDDGPCFELYLNDPARHPEGLHEIEIWEPVKPL
jgi:AraC family transcriptional regulator